MKEGEESNVSTKPPFIYQYTRCFFKIIFRGKIHANDIFLFFKNYF